MAVKGRGAQGDSVKGRASKGSGAGLGTSSGGDSSRGTSARGNARLSSLTPQFEYDAASGEYRYASGPSKGRAVSRLKVREVLDGVIEKQNAKVRSLAEQMRAREISLPDFQKEMERSVAKIHLASAAAARGGWHNMTPIQYEGAQELVGKELGGEPGVHGGLRGMCRDIENGLALDGRFLQRVTQYSEAGRHTYHVFETLEMNERGMNEQRFIRHAQDSCDECVTLAALGWHEIGSTKEPGERICLRRCKCGKEYRENQVEQNTSELYTKEQQNPFDELLPIEEVSEAAVLRDLNRIKSYLRRHFPEAKSLWNGRIEIKPAWEIPGAGSFNPKTGVMELSIENMGLKAARWSTMLHEMLHTIEDEIDVPYNKHKGWVEAVLEQVQRSVRPHMLDELQIDISEKALQWRDENHAYRRYIRALEGLRVALGPAAGPPDEFYYTLYATPVSQRRVIIEEMAQSLPDASRAHVLQTMYGTRYERGADFILRNADKPSRRVR